MSAQIEVDPLAASQPYYRARCYDPAAGRFISQDPLGFVNGPNLSVYVSNDGINYLDPMGTAQLCCRPANVSPAKVWANP